MCFSVCLFRALILFDIISDLDSRLFLDCSSDFCVYDELEEVIVAVALVKPKPGIHEFWLKRCECS